ncbi:MAG: hypothetical protein Q8J88_12835 [Bacteroidales bacterium]|nr:hypothetical protein [Bacteroidales bacterium]
MKKENKILLIKALAEELDAGDQVMLQKQLDSDQTMKETLHAWRKIDSSLKNYHPDFGQGFTQSVLMRIIQRNDQFERQKDLFRLMVRISMSAAAAVVLLLLYVVWQENSITLDGLLGLAGLKSDDFTNLIANY